jgi:hypothetical protein
VLYEFDIGILIGYLILMQIAALVAFAWLARSIRPKAGEIASSGARRR